MGLILLLAAALACAAGSLLLGMAHNEKGATLPERFVMVIAAVMCFVFGVAVLTFLLSRMPVI